MHQIVDVQKWADVMTAAEAFEEPFNNVNVTTAKAEYVALAYSAAVAALTEGGITPSTDTITKAVRQLIASNKVYVQESITVDDDGISACVNVESVDADDVTWRVMDMMAQALDALGRAKGVVRFGGPIQFTLTDVPWAISGDFALQPFAHA